MKFINENLTMSKRIQFLIITAITVLPMIHYAQVGGISGSKISASTVDVVDHHKLEFEPSFFHFKANKFWDENSNLQDLYLNQDSIKWGTSLNFRITYGLFDKFEIGTSISSDLLLIQIGTRYILYNNKNTGLALVGGLNLPLGNKSVSKSLRYSNTISKAGGGLVFTGYLNNDFSVDINAQYFSSIENSIDKSTSNIYLNSDFGYYVMLRQLQFIAGFGYQFLQYGDFDTQIFTFFPGITVETGKQYIIVLGGLIDLWGKNAIKNNGAVLALTITFE